MPDRRFALLGHPVGHTMSPYIHERLFALRGREEEYGVLDLTSERLAVAMRGLIPFLSGVNVTIPHKTAVIPFLDGLDERAARYGSVNTIRCETGKTTGFTTDPDGFLLALRHGGIALHGRVVILGAGGAARVAAFEAAQAGCEVGLAVREGSLPKARSLCGDILAAAKNARVGVCTLQDVTGDIDLLINATPCGMHPHLDGMPLDASALRGAANVFDMIYNPAETRLVQTARANGSKVLSGMPMLVWQAAAAHTVWDGDTYSAFEMEALCEEANAEMHRRFPG